MWAVYLSDRTTIYEFTEIPVSDLPEEGTAGTGIREICGDGRRTVRVSGELFQLNAEPVNRDALDESGRIVYNAV